MKAAMATAARPPKAGLKAPALLVAAGGTLYDGVLETAGGAVYDAGGVVMCVARVDEVTTGQYGPPGQTYEIVLEIGMVSIVTLVVGG